MGELISVVIPTFNRIHSIERAIKSVLEQSYTNRELIVVDDGSSDATCERLSQFGSQVQLIRQTNAGPSVARNTGIRLAKGEFVAFLDSDDEWVPDKLERQQRLMQDKRVVFSATNWRSKNPTAGSTPFDLADSEECWICDHPAEYVSQPRHIMLSSWLVRRDSLVALGGFNASLTLAEDNELLFRLAFAGSFAFTKKVLLLRETAKDSVKLSRPGVLNYDRNLARAMTRALAGARVLAFSESELAQRQFGKMYAYWLRREMEFAALEGRFRMSRRLALETLLHNPDAHSAVAAGVTFAFPFFTRRRMRQKYPEGGAS